jgi:carbon-monoxide dehydrogenase medium subunit
MKFANPASRYALVGVAVAQTSGGPRVAVTGAGSNGVFRHKAMEAALAKAWAAPSLAGVPTGASDMMSDMHADAAYRAHLVGVLARRAVTKAG